MCISFPFRPKIIQAGTSWGREASNWEGFGRKQTWYQLKDSLQQVTPLIFWTPAWPAFNERSSRIIKKEAVVQAQRVWNVWNGRALFPIYWLTHLNFACVNWRQRYSIDKRPTLAAEFTAALGGRTSQSMEAGNSKSWDGLETKPLAKENCNWGVLGAGLSLLCLLMWFHQQVSRTHFHHLQPIKSISCRGSHAWTCHGRRWLCWTTPLIPGRTEQTQWCIADICRGSSKTQVVVWIQAKKNPTINSMLSLVHLFLDSWGPPVAS